MKCPRCGADMKDGDLYCEKCGEEILIVPEFEPEIEYSLHETLSGIVEDVLEEVPGEPKQEKTQEEKEKLAEKKQKRERVYVIAAALAAVITVSAALGVDAYLNYRAGSVEYQMKKADKCMSEGDPEGAISYCRRAVALDETDVSLRFTLAGYYEQLGMETEYTDCLFEILRSGFAGEEDAHQAYGLLIAFYEKKQDYASINTLLTNAADEEIREAYVNYMALPPEFSYQGGTYAELIPLKLSACAEGNIYYTLDGTMPDEESEIYTTPIFLETGTYVVSAMFVNEYGIKSEAVAKTYVIDVLTPPAPDVETYSGEYTEPTMIMVNVPEEGDVYYTLDGTVPTDTSERYEGPIPMPLGKSTFKFVTYSEEGVPGRCTTRQYELTLATDVTPAQAVKRLGEVISQSIRPPETVTGEGSYLYMFQYALRIAGQGDFYVVVEIYSDAEGMLRYTGAVYAVDIYTQECYMLFRDGTGNYMLNALIQK